MVFIIVIAARVDFSGAKLLDDQNTFHPGLIMGRKAAQKGIASRSLRRGERGPAAFLGAQKWNYDENLLGERWRLIVLSFRSHRRGSVGEGIRTRLQENPIVAHCILRQVPLVR